MCKFLKKLFKKNEKQVTITSFMNTQIENAGGYLPFAINKDMLEELMKQFPKSEHPEIIDNMGKLTFTNKEGKTVKIDVPLLTIVPIPTISKDDIDLDKYYKENFGDSNPKKDIKDIETVKINVPAISITPIPAIPIKDKNTKNK